MIDFTRNSKLLTESWMKAFGAWNKTILKYIYGKDVDMVANLNEENSLNFVTIPLAVTVSFNKISVEIALSVLKRK